MNTALYRQLWIVSAVLINMFVQGIMISYPSSLLPGLQDPNSLIKADLNTATWLASFVGLSSALGTLLSSILMNFFGRKRAQIICTIPGLIGWLMIYFATDIPTIMWGRVFGGTTGGAVVNIAPVVIGEYTSPKYRGVFLNLKTAVYCIGSMFLHIITYYLSWRGITLVAAALNIIVLLITLTWPESPAWLASKQQYDRSEQAFYWLRGRGEASTNEIEELITNQIHRMKYERKSTTWPKIVGLFKQFTQKHFLKPLLVAIVGSVLMETSGRHYFPAYAIQIIGLVSEKKSETFYHTIVLDIIITTSAVSSSVLVKMMKRRTLLFSTGFAAVAVLASVCVYLYLISLDIVSKEKSWIAITLLVVYFILANLGCTPIPFTLLGEIFPLANRELGLAISGISISLLLMVALQLTPYMLVAFNVYGMFAIFGALMTISLVILYFIVPETKDKTLQEIENYFRYGKYERVTFVDKEAETNMIESIP